MGWGGERQKSLSTDSSVRGTIFFSGTSSSLNFCGCFSQSDFGGILAAAWVAGYMSGSECAVDEAPARGESCGRRVNQTTSARCSKLPARCYSASSRDWDLVPGT